MCTVTVFVQELSQLRRFPRTRLPDDNNNYNNNKSENQ